MAFLNKLKETAKNIGEKTTVIAKDLSEKTTEIAKDLGEKTSDAIEIGKLQAKIGTEKSAMKDDIRLIGEFYYNYFLNGGEIIPEALEVCERALGHANKIEALRLEIEKVKAEDTFNADEEIIETVEEKVEDVVEVIEEKVEDVVEVVEEKVEEVTETVEDEEEIIIHERLTIE